MSANEIAAIISAIASLVAAFGSVFAVVLGLRNGRKIEEVHLSTDGMRADLVLATSEAAYAEGVKAGIKQQQPS